jgi:UTP--glucose-1-phosphate uridylyltransferase
VSEAEFDWSEIEGALRAQCGSLDVHLDRAWMEARARDVREGRIGPRLNRLASDPRPAGPEDVDAIERLDPAQQRELEALGRDLLARGKVVAAVLNGGMATRFGGVVKGVVPVFGTQSFLELKLRQALRAGATPFLVMNSFATHAATAELLQKLPRERSAQRAGGAGGSALDDTRCFLQSVAVRLDPASGPFRDRAGALSFYAPGHGEFAAVLRRSGELARLQRDGVEIVVLSNVDNLGADIDPRIIGYHARSGRSITCEVARTVAGDKGGSPARVDGALQIVEGFRFPRDFDFDRLVYLSTNTFVFSLEVLQREITLPCYHVEKEVDGKTAVQVESIINELTQHAPSNFLEVQRSGPNGRFFPVKVPADLEAIRRDADLIRRFSA